MTETKFAIVGARFRPPAQEILDMCAAGQPLLVRRQPDNPYDQKAIAVLLINPTPDMQQIMQFHDCGPTDPLHIGFVPAKDNAELAAEMDASASEETNFLIPDRKATLTFSVSGGPMVLVSDELVPVVAHD